MFFLLDIIIHTAEIFVSHLFIYISDITDVITYFKYLKYC